MLGRGLNGPCQAQSRALVRAVSHHADEGHPPGRDRARLVDDDGVDATGGFQHLRSLDQDAELCPPAGADEQRGRRGQTERARAGDDEHRHRRRQGSRRTGPGGQPPDERPQSDQHHHGNEDGADPVGQPLHLCLTALRLGDELGDLGQDRVGAHPACPHDQPSACIDRRAGDRVARAHLDRDALAGQQARVDCGVALLHDAVSRNLFSGTDQEVGARLQVGDGDAPLDRAALAVLQHRDVFGAEVEQRAQGSARPALRARLEVAPGQDEHGHGRRDFQVRLVEPTTTPRQQVKGHLHPRVAGRAEEQRHDRP